MAERDGYVWPTARAEDSESCGNHPGATDSLTGATRAWLTPHGMNGQDHTGKQGRGGEFAKQATEWQTPKASEAEHSGRTTDSGHQSTLGTMANLWQTPATDSFRSRGGDRKEEMGLDQEARFWPTPNTPSGGPNTKSTATHTGVMDLDGSVLMWGTPTSRDYKDGSSADTAPTNGLLGRQVIQNWPTPDANAINDGESRESWQARADKLKLLKKNGNGAGMPLAIACLSSLPAPPIPDGLQSSDTSPGSLLPSQRKKLSPLFAAWLQGWPIWWCMKEPMPSAQSEMESVLYRLRSQLQSLLGE